MENDELTLTVRLHDPQEKTDEKKAAIWVVSKVPRTDLQLAPADFAAKYFADAAAAVLGPHQ